MNHQRLVRTIDGPIDAVVTVPGSKSIANRAMVCAALARGRSELANVPDGDDTVAMAECLGRLGVGIDDVGRDRSIVGGLDSVPEGEVVLHAGLAGTTSRFLTALVATVDRPIIIDGLPPLRDRPFAPLFDALVELGVSVVSQGTFGHLPATVHGPPRHGLVSIQGDVSSQYLSALMMIGPYLPGGLQLTITTPLVSRPYVDMTAAVMGAFGHSDLHIAEVEVRVGPGRYVPTQFTIEPDASAASYPLAIVAIVGGSVTVPGLGSASLQGDRRFADLLASMGCTVELTADATRLTMPPRPSLTGIDVDMSDISDLVPTLAVVAAFASTPTRMRGVGFIRDKESDRLGGLAAELRKSGVDIDEHDDGLTVHPSVGHLSGAALATHHDHRLAMAFGVLGSRVDGVEVADPDVVTKSWPGYWAMLDGLAR